MTSQRLLVAVFTVSCIALSTGNHDNTTTLTYPGRVLNTTQGECPSDVQRETVIAEVNEDICNLLHQLGWDLTELWVSNVTGFSSQYNSGSGGWSASQVIGPPKVYPGYGDIQGSWAPRAKGNREFLELEFGQEIYIKNISIYETYNSGVVTNISVWNSQTQAFQFVYHGEAEALTYSRIFTPQIDTIVFKSKRIRLDLDCTVTQSWCEIDAVKITGNWISPECTYVTFIDSDPNSKYLVAKQIFRVTKNVINFTVSSEECFKSALTAGTMNA